MRKVLLILLAIFVVAMGCSVKTEPAVPTTHDLATIEVEDEPAAPEPETILEPVETEPEAVVPVEEPAASTLDVLIHRKNLDPETITINKGDTVTWKSVDERSHLIISKTGPAEFRSQTLKQGDTFSYTFEESGTVGYIDGIFGSKGTVIVE